MKKKYNFFIYSIFFLFAFLLDIKIGFTSDRKCFIAKENNIELKVINYKECKKRYSPESSFKFVLSLIGFDSSILKDSSNPKWKINDEKLAFFSFHKNDQTPKTWMRDSAVWYSKILTNKLGIQKFKEYIEHFKYGNMDLSSGLDKAWLSGSLKISPEEQTIFIQKFLNKELNLNDIAHEKTKEIMFIQEMPNGWKLYGKTGNGFIENKIKKDKSKKLIENNKNLDANEENKIDIKNINKKNQHGWFIGWIEKDDRKIAFASHIYDKKPESTLASLRIRGDCYMNLVYLINEISK